MASDLSHPPSRLDPRSTACTQRTTDLGIYMYRRTQITKKIIIDKTDSQPEYTVPMCEPNSQKKLFAASTDSLESKISLFCTEHVRQCPGIPDVRCVDPSVLGWVYVLARQFFRWHPVRGGRGRALPILGERPRQPLRRRGCSSPVCVHLRAAGMRPLELPGTPVTRYPSPLSNRDRIGVGANPPKTFCL